MRRPIRLVTSIAASALLGLFALNAQAQSYSYGEKLDIAKVIGFDIPKSRTCQVITATMKYQDSQGQIKTMEYQQLAPVCTRID